MTIREVCDLAYTLLVEQSERRAVALWSAAGGEGTDPAAAREAFDSMLSSVPTNVDLRIALGVL